MFRSDESLDTLFRPPHDLPTMRACYLPYQLPTSPIMLAAIAPGGSS